MISDQIMCEYEEERKETLREEHAFLYQTDKTMQG